MNTMNLFLRLNLYAQVGCELKDFNAFIAYHIMLFVSDTIQMSVR